MRLAAGTAKLAVILGLVGICVCLWLLRAATDPDPPPAAPAPVGGAATAARPAPAPSAVVSAPLPVSPELPPPPEPPELGGQDTIDPCSAGFEPAIPPGFEAVTADGITVASVPGAAAEGPYDVALQPTAVAYLVNGLLVEAAALTATPRRERITVVVYPSPAVLRAATRAPAWSDGVYDGGAVRIAVKPTAELGVEIAGLRHELMHAQLHAAIGCMPSWLNEGLAMHFAGAAPVRAWIRMLRSPDGFELGQLEVSSFVSLPGERAERAYAESLAMIEFIADRAGDAGLRAAVHTGPGPRGARGLWDRLYPGAGHRALLDALARRVFGVALGAELDAILRGPVCCHGLRSASELRCRLGAPRADRTRWIDPSSAPRATCDATW